MCWIEKEHDHYCPSCTHPIEFAGSDESYSADHYDDYTCPKCNNVFHFNDDGEETAGEKPL